MTLIDAVTDLLCRADLPGDGPRWLAADEATLWPSEALERLEAAGLFLRSAPADHWSCDECDEPHIERVLFFESEPAPGRPFIPCPAHGRVFLEPSRLRRWRFDAGTVANWVGTRLQTATTPYEVLPGRKWSLGVAPLPQGRRPVYLIRGARWRDAEAVFSKQPSAEVASVSFLLTPELPGGWSVPGQWVNLVHTFRIEGADLTLDFSVLTGDLNKDAEVPFAMHKQATLWELIYDGNAASIPDLVGLRYLAQLLRFPGRAFPALELVTLGRGLSVGSSNEDTAGLTLSKGYESQEVIDVAAREQYQRRIDQLDAQKSSFGLSPAESKELDDVRSHLRRSLKLGSKPRTVSASVEKARSSVAHALQRAYTAIDERLPQMAQYLRNSIETGSVFSYRPHAPIKWSIQVES